MITWRRKAEAQRYLRAAAWPWATTFVLLGIAAGLLIPAIERATQADFHRQLGVGAAEALLGAFISGFITVIGLSFSLGIAALTFGSSAVTPRIIREWQLRQASRIMVGILLFSVVYAFVVLAQVDPKDAPGYVPDVAVLLLVPLILLDVAALLSIFRALTRAVRFVESLDDLLRRALRETDRVYPLRLEKGEQESPPPARPAAATSTTIRSPRSGVVASVDVRALRTTAVQLDAVIELVPRIGGYVERDGSLLRVLPAHDVDAEPLQEAVALSDERTIDQDPLFAIRLMVDIGIRALSPAVNDPTTAVQALDRIGDLLSHVAHRRLDVNAAADAGCPDRVFVRTPTWSDFLELSFTELREFGGASTQVVRKLRAVLEDLLDSVPAQRRRSVEDQLRLLDECVARNFRDPDARRLASVADPDGLGGSGTQPG